MSKETRLEEARAVLVDLGLPRAQQNERTALCLLALLDLAPRKKWGQAASPRIGITPIMEWSREHYDKESLLSKTGQTCSKAR
jgi:hypothetical protein